MRQKIGVRIGLVLVALALGGAHAGLAQRAAGPPRQLQQLRLPLFEVDPRWPVLPANMAIGSVSGVFVDFKNHVWVAHRPDTVAAADPKQKITRKPGPPIMEFDVVGNYLQGWGGKGAGYDWPTQPHGLYVDHKNNVWIAGNGAGDDQVLKFSRDGKFVLQIGKPGQSKGNGDTENLHQPSNLWVSSRTNELFVADGYLNRRVIVFDADTGAYKRLWGANGNKPVDWPDRKTRGPREDTGTGPAPQQFNLVKAVAVSNDGFVYVADQVNNRIQVFTTEGKFVEEAHISRESLGEGTAAAIDFAPSQRQPYLYVADASNALIHIFERETLERLGSFGAEGSQPGQFRGLDSIAADEQGNIYTGEIQGRRAQKFEYRGRALPSSQ